MRSISQIYAEAVKVRNNYLQLTELNTERSGSKMSIINLLTYVMAVMIYTYESLLGAFEVQVADIINSRINGTGAWYATMAKKFQYNDNTGSNDEMQYNEDTLNIEYTEDNTEHQIIAKAVYQEEEEFSNNVIYLKVCKDNTNSDEANNGTVYMPLSDSELTAFKEYIKEIKFVGAVIYCISYPADILTIYATESCPIYYDDNYITAEQALEAIKDAMITFITDFEYNGYLYYQSVIDTLQSISHISDISFGVKIGVKSYNEPYKKYNDEVFVTNRLRLSSGYLKIIDASGNATINTDNIYLLPKSSAQ